MAALVCTLDPLPGSVYDRVVSYCFKIENQGTSAVDLIEVRPLSSERMTVSEPAAPTRVSRKRKLDEAFEQLSEMATIQFLATSDAYRMDVSMAVLETFDRMVAQVKSPLSWVRWTTRLVPRKTRARDQAGFIRQLRSQTVVIDEVETAEEMLGLFPEESAQGTLYASRLGRLQRLLRDDNVPRAVTTLEPGGTYETRFDVAYDRRPLSISPYTFAVEAFYDDVPTPGESDPAGPTPPRTLRASATAFISPSPQLLTLMAVVSALVGVAIQAALEEPRDTNWDAVRLHVVSGYGFAALLLAGVVFNIYDHLELGRTVRMPASWRSALLVGTLCGLFAVQILGSIGVLVGASPSPIRHELHDDSQREQPVPPPSADRSRDDPRSLSVADSLGTEGDPPPLTP